jgi:hypothetical protein
MAGGPPTGTVTGLLKWPAFAMLRGELLALLAGDERLAVTRVE